MCRALHMRAAAALLLALGVLVLMTFHADALERVYGGEAYLPWEPRVLGLGLAGICGTTCALLVLWRGRERGERRRSAVEVAWAGLPLLAVVAVLVGSIAVAFTTRLETDLLLRVGGWGFFAAAFGALAALGVQLVRVARGSVRDRGSTRVLPSAGVRFALAAALPLNVILMAHGCGYPGCNPTCAVMTYGAAGLAGLAFFEAAGGRSVLALCALLTAYAFPHCTCANPINAAWIELLGVSPNCFAFAMLGGLFAVAGLRGILPRAGLALAFAPGLAAAAFAVGHHVFHYPW